MKTDADMESVSRQLRVVLIDPSNFTLPYDNLLAKGLSANGCEVTLLKRPDRPNECRTERPVREVNHFYRFSEQHRNLLHRLRLFRIVKAIEHIWNMLALKKLLERLDVDIVHFQWFVIPWLDQRLASLVLRNYKTVITVHDTKLYHGTGSTKLQAFGWLKVLSSFDRLIVHTRMSRDKVVEAGVPTDRVTVVPHGTIPIYRDTGEVPAQRVDALADEVGTRLLFFGFLKKYKGVATLASALERLPPDILRRIHLTVAGKPHAEVEPELERIRKCVSPELRCMDLRFLSDEDLHQYIASSDVVLFPYDRIDASGAFMATVPYGKIVVASRVGVFDESLIDGETGILIDPGSSKDLAGAIKKLVEDREFRLKMAAGAARFASEIPGWEKIGLYTKTVYLEI